MMCGTDTFLGKFLHALVLGQRFVFEDPFAPISHLLVPQRQVVVEPLDLPLTFAATDWRVLLVSANEGDHRRHLVVIPFVEAQE